MIEKPRLASVFDEFERAKASARRIFGLMDTPNQIPNPENPVQIEKIQGDIQLQNVFLNDIMLKRNKSLFLKH